MKRSWNPAEVGEGTGRVGPVRACTMLLMALAACTAPRAAQRMPDSATVAAKPVDPFPFPDPALDPPERINPRLHDTLSGAYRETGIMTGKLDVMFPGPAAVDSVAWAASPDSCAIMARLYLAKADRAGSKVSGYEVSETWGSTNIGAADPIVSPDWLWYARRDVELVPRKGEDTVLARLAGQSGSTVEALRPRVQRFAGQGRGILFSYIVYLLDGFGSEEPRRLLDPRQGTGRLAWRRDALELMVRDSLDTMQVKRLDPRTSKVVGTGGVAEYRIPFVVAGRAALARRDTLPTPRRRHLFWVRHDSTFVSGPDQRGRPQERFVAPGRPILTTRNGEYTLMVEERGGRSIVSMVRLTLAHAAFTSSCDRGKKLGPAW